MKGINCSHCRRHINSLGAIKSHLDFGYTIPKLPASIVSESVKAGKVNPAFGERPGLNYSWVGLIFFLNAGL